MEGAWVYVAYEHTLAYESLRSAGDFRISDHGGFADLPVFGVSRIRVFAEQIIDSSPRYSAPVELETGKLPDNLNLVISSSELPRSR